MSRCSQHRPRRSGRPGTTRRQCLRTTLPGSIGQPFKLPANEQNYLYGSVMIALVTKWSVLTLIWSAALNCITFEPPDMQSRTGNQRLQAVGSLPSSLKPGWKFKTGGPVVSSAAVANGIVYIGSDDKNVYALSLADGTKVWAY